MKNTIIITILLCSFNCFSQIDFRVRAGLNYSRYYTVTDQTYLRYETDFRFGFHVGLVSDIQVGKRFLFSPELLFTQRGMKRDGIVNIRLDYLEIPLLLSYKVAGLNLVGGPSIAYLLSQSYNYATLSPEKKFDIGLNGGVRVTLFPKVSLEARYTFGVRPLIEAVLRDQNGSLIGTTTYQNSSFQFGLSYKLNND